MGRGRPSDRAGRGLRSLSAAVRIGTCSWADETLTKTWYPASVRTAEARLHHYAEQFDTVELNASYYALPSPDATAAWARRTPPGFVFHVKAFGMMTRHPVRAEQLPPDLRAEAPVDDRGRVDHPSRELRGEVFTRFRAALEPLREAGKLGGILMQFPSYITRKQASLEYLEWAKERLGGDEMMVEFRHRSWLEPEHAQDTLAFLRCARGDVCHGRRAPHRRPEPGADGRRHELGYGLPAPARPQRRHLERARPKRRGAVRLPVLARRAGRVVAAAARALVALGAHLRDVQQQRSQRRPGGADRTGADERAHAARDPARTTACRSRIDDDQAQREHAEDDAERGQDESHARVHSWRTGLRSSARSISRSRW